MMATRVGIELSPTACRIVELDGSMPWRRSKGDTRVRSFAVLPPSGPETQARLESLRRRHAAVVVWGGRTEHRQVIVTAGSYESMRAEAMAALSAAGLQTNGVWADIAIASPADDGAVRRPVVVSMASASDMAEALRPLREAGIRLRTVTTPAVALGSLARMRLPVSMPAAIESYIAFDEQVTCIALVRNGILLAARDLSWGFIDEDYARSELRSRDDITARLAEAIGEFVAAIGGSPGDIGQVCVCGGLPELRSMSAMLMERLDVEVEPLDSLFGIDAARLPEPADEFRERGAELRLAWAAAVDWPPGINLLRARKRQVSKAWLARAAVVAGATAGLSGSWWVVDRGHLWPAQQPATRIASNASARGRGLAPPKPSPPSVPPPVAVSQAPAVTAPPLAASKPPLVTPPLPVVNKVPAVTAPPVAASRPPLVTPPPVVNKAPAVTAPPVAASKPPLITLPPVVKAPVVTPPSVAANKPPATTRPPTTVTRSPVVSPATVMRPPVVTPPPAMVTRPPVAAPPPLVVERSPVRPAAAAKPPQSMVPPVRIEPAPARVKPAPPQEVALPFDAVLGTILFSPDRKLAIIDNRIVGVGDEVRGARVIEITTATVMLRDTQGRLRRLTLGAGGR